MKPPPPTQDLPQKKEPRYAAWIPIGVALVGVMVLAGYVYWQEYMTANLPRINPGAMTMTATQVDFDRAMDEGEGENNSVTAFVAGKTADQLVRLRPNDRPLVHDPAGLPTFRSDSQSPPVRTGLVRDEGGLTEEVAWVRFPLGTAAEVMEHYTAEAQKLGFVDAQLSAAAPGAKTGAAAPTTQPAVNRMFFRPRAADAPGNDAREVLVVRASPAGVGARVMIWFRYPSKAKG